MGQKGYTICWKKEIKTHFYPKTSGLSDIISFFNISPLGNEIEPPWLSHKFLKM